MKRKPSLNSLNWIEAGFRSLTANGPEGIRAEVIARELKVSKGSFYWHFKDVQALKTAMIDHWEKVATGSIIVDLEKSNTLSDERLRRLVDIATGKHNLPYGGVLSESAIRDWGRYDNMAAQCVERVDKKRLSYLATLFKEYGFTKLAAQKNANILYGALIGLGALSHRELVKLNPDLQHLLAVLLKEKAG